MGDRAAERRLRGDRLAHRRLVRAGRAVRLRRRLPSDAPRLHARHRWPRRRGARLLLDAVVRPAQRPSHRALRRTRALGRRGAAPRHGGARLLAARRLDAAWRARDGGHLPPRRGRLRHALPRKPPPRSDL
eukprot:scaffold1608_cov56-Phaeocystis_antarctica.AAC.1